MIFAKYFVIGAAWIVRHDEMRDNDNSIIAGLLSANSYECLNRYQWTYLVAPLGYPVTITHVLLASLLLSFIRCGRELRKCWLKWRWILGWLIARAESSHEIAELFFHPSMTDMLLHDMAWFYKDGTMRRWYYLSMNLKWITYYNEKWRVTRVAGYIWQLVSAKFTLHNELGS